MSGMLVMFDGPDGVGKTTQFKLLEAKLQQAGRRVYGTHILGGTPIGEALRMVLFSEAERPPQTNLHVSLAAYYALAAEVTKLRESGVDVLIDRSPLSLIAYQVYGDGLPLEIGKPACDDALSAFRPDAVLLYELPFDQLQARRQQQAATKPSDYFDQQRAEYHQRTVQGYQEAATLYQVWNIDASGSEAEVHEQTVEAITPLLTSQESSSSE